MNLRTWTALPVLTALLMVTAGCGDDDDDSERGDHAAERGAGKDAGSNSSADASKPSAPAKDADTGNDQDAELEVAGDWTSDFGDQSISLEDWDGAEVVEFDNDDNYAITHYPEDDEYSPDKFSKLVWTEPDAKGFYYCTVDFGLDTQTDAEASKKVADDSDPENGGCGDFPWTKLEPK